MSDETPEVFEIKVDGKGRDIKMTFGLLNELARIVGNAAQVTRVAVDQDLRDDFLECLLVERTPSGKRVGVADVEDLGLAPGQVLKLIEWSSMHVMDFLLEALAVSTRVDGAIIPRMGLLGISSGGSTGSEASAA